jgi:hypothetical protein
MGDPGPRRAGPDAGGDPGRWRRCGCSICNRGQAAVWPLSRPTASATAARSALTSCTVFYRNQRPDLPQLLSARAAEASARNAVGVSAAAVRGGTRPGHGPGSRPMFRGDGVEDGRAASLAAAVRARSGYLMISRRALVNCLLVPAALRRPEWRSLCRRWRPRGRRRLPRRSGDHAVAADLVRITWAADAEYEERRGLESRGPACRRLWRAGAAFVLSVCRIGAGGIWVTLVSAGRGDRVVRRRCRGRRACVATRSGRGPG